ncbi:Hypothetical protein A7982_11600 [Minicystis rosea]|nr:Hypothetical protein A7982_11600 [Minicystis rosea]
MRPYVIKQGDYLEKVAHALGSDPDKIWNDPKNAELKQQRDPNLLHPGDILYVPAPEPQWMPLTANTSNLYVAKVPRTKVSLVFKDLDEPRANEPYVIHGMGEPEEGTTDGNGALEISVPVHVRELQVMFPKSHVTYPVHVGDMDPIGEPTGVRKRLQHLGYYEEPSADAGEGDTEAAERAAIHAFQIDHELLPTGTLDDETRSMLLEKHGG